MMGPRSPEKSEALHKKIYELWRFKQMNADAITNFINADATLVAQFGKKVSVDGVRYHLKIIKQEMDNMVDEDLLETATADFIRLVEQIDDEIHDVQSLIDGLDKNEDKETWIRAKRLKMELLDKRHKVLIDSAVPLQIKKINKMKKKIIKPLNPIPLTDEEKEEGK